MNLNCVTSLTKEYYSDIGKYMIQSWCMYWPTDATLTVYAEGFDIQITDPRVKILDWDERCGNLQANFKYITYPQSNRFSKKGFAFFDFMESNVKGYVIWLDADLLFFNTIPDDLISSLLPKEKVIAFFDCYYQTNPNYTPEEYVNYKNRKHIAAESGFVIVNASHQNYNDYVRNYKELYTSKEKHETLTSWYDGEVCVSAIRDRLDLVVDLSQLRTTNKTQTPLNRTHLRNYMHHLKAGSKRNLTSVDYEKFINSGP